MQRALFVALVLACLPFVLIGLGPAADGAHSASWPGVLAAALRGGLLGGIDDLITRGAAGFSLPAVHGSLWLAIAKAGLLTGFAMTFLGGVTRCFSGYSAMRPVPLPVHRPPHTLTKITRPQIVSLR